jgi:hypothetical protein
MDLHHLLLAGLPAHSALPLKADSDQTSSEVRFVPGGEIGGPMAYLLDTNRQPGVG